MFHIEHNDPQKMLQLLAPFLPEHFRSCGFRAPSTHWENSFGLPKSHHITSLCQMADFLPARLTLK